MLDHVPTVSAEERFGNVYDIFSDFRKRTATGKGRLDEMRMPTGRPNLLSGQTQVFSLYSAEEEPYIFRVSSLLTQIAAGNSGKGKALSKRIVTDFSNQKGSRSFSRAVANGILDCLKEFSEKHHAMVPALDALYATLGSEGTMLSVAASEQFLSDAISGTLNADTIKTHGKLPLSEFTSIRPAAGENAVEVQCTGMAFAQEIIHQAKIAAMELAHENSDDYTLEDEGKATACIQEESLALVRRIMEEACHV